MSDHLDPDAEVWADGSPVPWVGPTYPGDSQDPEAGEFDKGTAAFWMFLDRMMAIKDPKQRGEALAVLHWQLRPVGTLTAAAGENGLTKQAFAKKGKTLRGILPLWSTMTGEQRERVAAGMKESHRRRKEKGPLHTHAADLLNRSLSKPDNKALSSTSTVTPSPETKGEAV